VGRRKRKLGLVMGAPYLCRDSLAAGQQVPQKGLSLPSTLLCRPLSDITRYLDALSPEGHCHILVTPHATLVSLLGKGPAASPTNEEWVRLQLFFPELKKGTRRLSGLQRSHLWTLRLLQNEAALADLLELHAKGRLLPDQAGRRPIELPRFEIYLIDRRDQHDSFRHHIFPRGTDPLVGALLDLGPLPMPASLVWLGSGSALEKRRRLAFAATIPSIARHRRLKGGIPPWLMLGLAHFMEQRLWHQRAGRDLAGILPGKGPFDADWKKTVRSLILEGKTANFATLNTLGLGDLNAPLRMQSESIVRFLLGLDPKRFAKLIRRFLNRSLKSEALTLMRRAAKELYRTDLARLQRSWRLWASRER